MSIQNGVPDRSGTIRPYSFTGCKVLDAEFTCQVDGLLQCNFNFDANDVSEAQAAASPSYTAGILPFHWGQLAVKLGTFGAEAAVTGVTKVACKIERPQDTNNFYANGGGVKTEPIMNDFVKITGSLDVDFATKADFADRFANDTPTSMVLSWTGPIIASTFAYTFSINVPMTFFDGETPTLQNNGVVGTTYPFVGLYDASHSAVTVTYMSTDTTL